MQVSNSLLHRCKPAGLGWPSSAGPAPTFVTLYVVSMCICSFGASLPPAPEQIPKVGRNVLFIAKSWLHKARAQVVHWDFGSGSCSVSRLLDPHAKELTPLRECGCTRHAGVHWLEVHAIRSTYLAMSLCPLCCVLSKSRHVQPV